jgi:hypothetical protein
MTATTRAARITTMVPAKGIETPRGAILVGLVANFVLDLLAARRARQERRRIERDVSALRVWANEVHRSNPSMAADLYAAADRAI